MISWARPIGRLCTPRWNTVPPKGTLHSTDDWSSCVSGHSLQQNRSVDVVVIGERHEAHHSENILDLLTLNFISQLGR